MISYQDYQASVRLLEDLTLEEKIDALINFGVERVHGLVPLEKLPDSQIDSAYDSMTDEKGELEDTKKEIAYIKQEEGYTKLNGWVATEKGTPELINDTYDDAVEEAGEIVDNVGVTWAKFDVYQQIEQGKGPLEIKDHLHENYPERVFWELEKNYPLEQVHRAFSILEKEIKTSEGTPSIKSFS